MIYKVRAKYNKEKAGELFEKLTDGTISNQKPDGEEIISSIFCFIKVITGYNNFLTDVRTLSTPCRSPDLEL